MKTTGSFFALSGHTAALDSPKANHVRSRPPGTAQSRRSRQGPGETLGRSTPAFEGKAVELRDITRATTVGTRITIADTSLTRLVGLAGRRRLDAGCGLLIRPSCGIHTFGMLFSIDVVALDRRLEVLKLWHRLAPLRVTSISLKMHSILELPAGQINHCRIQVGDKLEFV
jgi:uncharacterized membrane protein (UPF0127 family)